MPTAGTLFQLLVIGLTNGAVIALNAIAVTLIYGAVRIINLAHGDVFGLTTVVVASLVTALGLQLGSPPLLLIGGLGATLAITVLFGSTLNVVIERIAFRPFRSRSRLAPLVATLGLSFILYQVALVWRYTEPNWLLGRPSHHGVPELPLNSIPEVLPTINLLGWLGGNISVTFKDLLVPALAVGCALGVRWFVQNTRTGKAIRAVAQNVELARIVGVNPDAIIRRTFALGGMLVGVAAFVFATYYTHPFTNAGAQSGLTALAAAILGGVGNPLGALFSGLLLGVGAAFSDFFLAAQWTPVLMQALLIGLLLFRPTGIAAGERAEDLMSNADRDAVTPTPPGQRGRWNHWLVWGFVA